MPDHYPSPYDSVFAREAQSVVLERLRVGLRRTIGAHFAERIAFDFRREVPDFLSDALVADVTAEVLAEKLPPHTITTRIGYEHPEAIGQPGVAVDARFERPIDHFTAKYRGRWWAPLLGLRRRPIRYQFVPVPYTVSRPVRCDHKVTTNVRASWTYPKANTVLPARDFGPVVLQTTTDSFADMVRSHAHLNSNTRW